MGKENFYRASALLLLLSIVLLILDDRYSPNPLFRDNKTASTQGEDVSNKTDKIADSKPATKKTEKDSPDRKDGPSTEENGDVDEPEEDKTEPEEALNEPDPNWPKEEPIVDDVQPNERDYREEDDYPNERDRSDEEKQRERERLFGKSYEQEIQESIDRGCDWLKKQQGIDPADPKPVFGKFPENPALYGSGEPHRYLIARTAFPIQALCSAGCFADGPEVEKAMNWLRKNYKEDGAIRNLQGNVASTTYEDATVLLAIEAYYISVWEARDRKLTNKSKRFKKNRNGKYLKDRNGKKIPLKRWGVDDEDYKYKKRKKKKKGRNLILSKADEKMAKLAVEALMNRYRTAYGGGGWRYGPKGRGESKPMIDVSATQYAMLGLKAATRLGIEYNKKKLFNMYHYLRLGQDKDGPVVKTVVNEGDRRPTGDRGKVKSTDWQPDKEYKARGWAYTRKDIHNQGDDQTYGSMTAAAINALILIRDELVEDRAHKGRWKKKVKGVTMEEQCNNMIGDGLAWMTVNWTMANNPRRGMYRYYYYLNSVKRLCSYANIDLIGGHDWYYEGSQVLLKDQQESGMWDIDMEIDPSDIYNTCYALLFLAKSDSGADRPIPVVTGDE